MANSMYMSVTEKNVKLDFAVENFRKGKIRYKSLHYCDLSTTFPNLDTNIVSNVIIMSDIHSCTPDVIDRLIKKNIMNSKSLVITTGDMCGDIDPQKALGHNADPYTEYAKINNTVPYFYMVQGNHDFSNQKVYDLRNKDKTPCCVDQIVVQTPIGKVGGVNGIVC